jgi:hypothetical protein
MLRKFFILGAQKKRFSKETIELASSATHDLLI